MISLKGKFPSVVDDRARRNIFQIAIFEATREGTTMTMSRVYAALIASAVTAMALPTAASAQCAGCYTPPPQPCVTCYQRQVVPPQYRTVEETVMVSPEGVHYERTAPQYATRQRVEMVAPAREYYAATPLRCSSCGY